MATDIPPLRERCFKRIALLLKDYHWGLDLPEDENPFRRLPSVFIDELITYVAEISGRTDILLCSQLQLLIRTGRVQHFKLQDTEFGIGICIDKGNLKRILKEVSSSSDNLVSVKINIKMWRSKVASDVRDALTSLLLKHARNIRHVESNIPFDITALRGATQLEKLVTRFEMDGYRISRLLSVKGQFFKRAQPHSFLKELILQDTKHVSYKDIATVLKYCTELISIQCDISKSLKMLHAEELHSDSLTHKYKLQKCHLGFKADVSSHKDIERVFEYAHADSLSVRIASVTCPYLQDVKIYVKDFESISALNECRNLHSLAIYWQGLPSTYYKEGVRSILEKTDFGLRLKSLELLCFYDIDFDSIGVFCPNLERLRFVNYYRCNISNEVLATSFQKLKYLHCYGVFLGADGELYDLPVGFLSTALHLEELSLRFVADDNLTLMLGANPLSKLKILTICWCGLSSRGFRKLASSLASLECLILQHTHSPFEEVASIFRELNPRVLLRVKTVK